MGREREYDGVRPASNSTIEIDFYYAQKRCRERIKLKPTPANLKRAAQHRASILAAIENGEFDYGITFPNSKRSLQLAHRPGSVITVEAFLDAWLKRRRPTLKASTFDGYEKIVVGHLSPKFGNRPIGELRRGEIREWSAKLTCGNKRIANILSVFRAALQEAFEDETIESNPLRGWVYRKNEPPKDDEDVDPFVIAEQAAILKNLEGQGRNLVQTAFWTGMRTSELVALDWGDIDWVRGVICVTRAQTQAADAAERPKTIAGAREIKLLPPAIEALVAQKSHTLLNGHEVFQNPRTEKRWTGDQPIRRTLWTHALLRAGVRYRPPYQTRHTFASMMLSAGEHPMWVAQQMGHKDWGLIRKIYGKWIPDAAPEAGSKAVSMFGQVNADAGSIPDSATELGTESQQAK